MAEDREVLFDEIARRHAGLVRRTAETYEVSPAAREDLVQEVWLAVWRALPTWRGEASLKTFVARIAHNVAVGHVRRATAERRRRSAAAPDPSDPPPPDPEREAGDALARERLAAAVRALPLALRQPLALHLEGLENEEIALALGVSKGATAVRLTRARAALQSMLGDPR